MSTILLIFVLLQPFKLSNITEFNPLSIGRVERLLVGDGFFIDMIQIKSHEQFLKDIHKSNKYYRKGDFKIIGKYENWNIPILCEDRYGLTLALIGTLIGGSKPSIFSAIDKTEYFKNKLKDKNQHFCNGEFDIIGEYIGYNTPILCKDKCGITKNNPRYLLSDNKKPTIKSAINPTEYFRNKIKEVHGDKYTYEKTKYKNIRTEIEITCPLHGSFWQTPNTHLSGIGCKKCAYERNVENSIGWSYTKWASVAKKSKNFDSFKVYIIWCYNDQESFIKIGKTFTTVKWRFGCKSSMPYQYQIVKEIKGSAREICELETNLKRLNKKRKYIPKINFRGKQECFSEVTI